MSGFTPQEKEALQEFRRRVSDVLPSDEFSQRDDFLIRWIRAREMDLDKAEEMIRNSMKWREENKIDRILDSGITPEMMERFPFEITAVDKSGRPVITMPFGEWDVRSFIESDGTEQFVVFTNQYMESMVEAIKCSTAKLEKKSEDENKNGNNKEISNGSSKNGAAGKEKSACIQCVLISDMSGYAFRQLTNMKAVQSLISMISVFEAHYPETMGKIIVINAPTVFSILFGMIKPFMSAHTVSKVKIFSSKKEQWLPEVLDLIDPSEIPERYGGTKIQKST